MNVAVPPATPAPDPARLLAAARGFSAAFWGLALTVLLLADLVRMRPLSMLQLPGHAAGVVLLLASAGWMWRTRGLSPRWDRLVAQYVAAVALQMYLLPFLGWWRTIDHSGYYLANLALAVSGTLWLLLVLHVLVIELARRLADPVLLVEGRIALWVSPLLAGVALGLYLLGAFWMAGLDRWNILYLLRSLMVAQGPWRHLPAILPFLLALAVCWEAKERCFRGLAPPPEAPEST